MLSFIGGIVALIAGIWLWTISIHGHQLFRLFLKALAAVGPFCLVAGGIVLLIAGISSMREKAADSKDAQAVEKK